MSEDEKDVVSQTFVETGSAASENLFIERWYQLLKEGGEFCCVLPEAVLDTASNEKIRQFMVTHFKIIAVISLPYDAFRPFTSTKTCIVRAQKRTTAEIAEWVASFARIGKELRKRPSQVIFSRALEEVGWSEESIFMAEPKQIGYKRRKNLPDLDTPNDLFEASKGGGVRWSIGKLSGHLCSEELMETVRSGMHSSAFGLRCTIFPCAAGFNSIRSTDGCGISKMELVCGDISRVVRLDTIFDVVELAKVPEGDLAQETRLIDLEFVESRQAIVRDDEVPIVDTVGSTKVSFRGADLVISRLEPYLGKVIVDPPAGAIGSTEWIGLKVKNEFPITVAAYLLMLPETCEGTADCHQANGTLG